jgi:membrane-bound lytic murein transglycosylase B
MSNRLIVSLLLHCLLSSAVFFSHSATALEITPPVKQFIDKMVKQHGFEQTKLTALFQSVGLNKTALAVMSKPAEGVMPWYQYRQRLLTEQRIAAGVKFWQEQHSLLAEIEQKYGVPAHIIVAIIGIETFYGKDSGRYRVIDSLATLGFFYPRRSEFFLTELEQFLLLCREENLNPLVPLGSYAGAMGMGQFMPGSVRTYAVDYDNDKSRNIWHSRADILASVANYLAKYGWQRGQGIAYQVTAKGEKHLPLLQSKEIIPDLTLKQLQDFGIILPASLNLSDKAKLFSFAQEQSAELWLTLTNFYVITRYNRSLLYAMAVHQLGSAILARKETRHE